MSKTIWAVLIPVSLLSLASFAIAQFSADLPTQRFFDNVHWTISELGAALIAWLGALHAPAAQRDVRRRLAWALSIYALGQCVWDLQVALHWNPFPAVADLLFLCLGLFSLLAIWHLLRLRLAKIQRWAAALDAAALSVGGLSLTLGLYLPDAHHVSMLQLLTYALYPIGLIGAASVTAIAMLYLQPRLHWSWLLVLLALLTHGIIWLIWNHLILDQQPTDGLPFNLSFSLASLALGVGVANWQVEGAAYRKQHYELLARLLPIWVVAAVILSQLLVTVSPAMPSVVKQSTLTLSPMIIVIAIVRQSVLLTESERLLEADRRASEHESRFRRLADTVQDIIFRIGIPGGRFDYLSPAVRTVFGDSPEYWRQRPNLLPERVRDDHREHFLTLWTQLLSGNPPAVMEYPIVTRDDQVRWLQQRNIVARDDTNTVVAVEGIISDVTAQKSTQERYEFLALHDALTGLANRSLFERRLEQAWARAQRHQLCFAVLFIDLDQFKAINDGLGHAAGDRLLQEMATRLSGQLRREDTLARWGGDEFTALVEDLHSGEDALVVAQALLEAACTPFGKDDEQGIAVTASIGVSIFPDDTRLTAELIRNADTAMYAAKNRGGNQACFYSATMTEQARERLGIRNGLRRALERQELTLHYQPLVDGMGDIIGAEALLRWPQGPGENLRPDVFIPIAESSGLISPIGAWALETACRQAVRWLQTHPQFTMAVNVSPRQLRQREFVEQVVGALQRSALPSAQLILEITESSIVDAGELGAELIRDLKSLGVQIAIDDFGTGLSSLASLKRYAVDVLKIDRSFVRDIPGDRGDMEIASTIVAMARNLGLCVTAEGVETPEQLDFLRERGCHHYQGFLFCPPVPPDTLSALLLRPGSGSSRFNLPAGGAAVRSNTAL